MRSSQRYLKESSEAENLNLLVEANKFLDGVTPKIEEAKKAVELTKKSSNDFLEAMNKYNSLMLSAKQALKEVQGFPGAEKQIALLETLIKNCARIPKQDKNGLWTGHAEACQKLEKYPVLVTNIQLTSKQHLSKDVSPELTKKYQELINGELVKLNKIAPPELVRMYLDKARDAVRLGRENPEQAQKDLQGVEQSLKDEVGKQTTSSEEAAKLKEQFDGYIEELNKAGVPLIIYAEPQRIGEAAKQNELANRQWTAACQLLGMANKSLSTIVESYEKHGEKWKENRQTLEEYQKSVGLWIKVPSLAVQAYKLSTTVIDLLNEFKQFKFEANNKAFDETKVDNLSLAQLYEKLKELAEKANVDSKVTQEEMIAFVRDLNLAQTLVADAVDVAQKKLKTGVSKLPVSDPQDLELLHKFYVDEVNGVWNEWQTFRSEVKFGDEVIAEAERLVKELEQMEVDKRKVDEIPNLRKAEAPRRAEKLRADIESALEECVSMGRDVNYLYEQLKQIRNSEFEKLQEIEKVVLEKRNNARLNQSLLISHQQVKLKNSSPRAL